MDPLTLQGRLRQLPSVDRVLRDERIAGMIQDSASRAKAVPIIRKVLLDLRTKLRLDPAHPQVTIDDVVSRVQDRLRSARNRSLRPAINATGVILHTGLGRAPLGSGALEEVVEVCKGYSNLEIDLASGARSSRQHHVRELLRELTGAESALVVNNNAGALLLVVNTFARGFEVIVSRGELVEIGDAFRLPEIIEAAGGRLVEVGTTNRTYLSDYERALTSATRLILKVHPSNFRIIGFTESARTEDLVQLASRAGIPMLYDLGSGALVDSRKYCPASEPTVQKAIEDGVSLAIFSADKLLGGPQGGIIVGQGELIEKLSKNPMCRALRVGKLSLAALEWTLRQYRDGAFEDRLPIWHMISLKPNQLSRRAESLCSALKGVLGDEGYVEVTDDYSEIGGGALPGVELGTKVVSVRFAWANPASVADFLRTWDPPIFVRTKRDRLMFDVRTIEPSQFRSIAMAFKGYISKHLGEKSCGP